MPRIDPFLPPARRSRSVALSGVALAALLVLTACGADDADKSSSQVASLPTSAAPAQDRPAAPGTAGGQVGAPPATSADTSQAPTAGRPQRRLDTSEEEEKRMWAAYEACLTGKGVDTRQTGSVEGEIARTKKYAREFKECEIKLPLMAPEMDRKTNPKYDDDMRNWVKCMNAKGMKVKVVSDGWTFTGESTLTNEQHRKIEQECKMEAFGGKR
ncbi:hypothetical protein [Embleya sp. NBC_00896]|uniref:hypothetical protein n=1 Tax=Embleya sp. NBC_00896 TaxID=2975961 RepID=UPI002F911ED0|nr:hypothetical protein OG928_42735 [Embleya sp. NBC_00896]